MNPDLKEFIEHQKNTYTSLIEQTINKKKELLIQAEKYEKDIQKYNYLLEELKEDEEKWKSS